MALQEAEGMVSEGVCTPAHGQGEGPEDSKLFAKRMTQMALGGAGVEQRSCGTKSFGDHPLRLLFAFPAPTSGSEEYTLKTFSCSLPRPQGRRNAHLKHFHALCSDPESLKVPSGWTFRREKVEKNAFFD